MQSDTAKLTDLDIEAACYDALIHAEKKVSDSEKKLKLQTEIEAKKLKTGKRILIGTNIFWLIILILK